MDLKMLSSLINLIKPISATILADFVLSQKITTNSIVGILLVLTAVIIILRPSKNTKLTQ